MTGERLVQGDDVTLTITAKDNNEAVINLTGASISFKLISDIGGSAVLTKATGGSGIVITSAAGGIFTVTLTAANTASLEGKYFYEIQVTDSGGLITTLRNNDQSLPYLYFLPDEIA